MLGTTYHVGKHFIRGMLALVTRESKLCNSPSKLYLLLLVVEKFVCFMLPIAHMNPSSYYSDYMDTC